MTEVLTPTNESEQIAPAPATQPARKSADERKEALARMVTAQVANGARVESQSDYQAVLVHGHRLNNTLHLILTIFTLASGESFGSSWPCSVARSARLPPLTSGGTTRSRGSMLPAVSEAQAGADTKTADERRSALARQIAILVAQGRRIESQSDYEAVLVAGRYLWESRELVAVDAWGNFSVQRLGVDKERLSLAFAVLAVIVILIVLSAVLG